MEDMLAAHLQSMEHTDRHPLLSFFSALFWVVRAFLSIFHNANNSDRTDSVLTIMGQGSGRLGHYQCPPSHIFLTFLLNDAHGSSHPNVIRSLSSTHSLIDGSSTFGHLPCYFAFGLSHSTIGFDSDTSTPMPS